MKATEQTLIEQMGFSERDIARRLHLLNVTSEDIGRIKSMQSHINQVLPNIIEDYYLFQLEDPEVASVIGDADTLARLKTYLAKYISSLLSGVYDGGYVNTRLRIGKVHKRLEVRPKLYMRAHAKLQLLLDNEIDASCFVEDASLIKTSLHKILLFDAELVFDAYAEAYLTEMQSATDEVERYSSEIGIKADNMFSRLYEKSQKDTLTDLPKRRALYDCLKHECEVAVRHKLEFVLIYLDLNGFKAVNDQHGHHAGDDVLVQTARSMLAATRSVDLSVRYGGDEFCMVLPRTSLADIDSPLKRLLSHFDKNCQFPVTFSLGVLQAGPEFFETPEELIQKADALMYEAKQLARQDGKHHWKFGQVEGNSENFLQEIV